MFPKSLKSVNRNVRNLPPDPDPVAPPPAVDADGDADGLTCPNCGASLKLKAVAETSTPPPAAPATPDGGMGGGL